MIKKGDIVDILSISTPYSAGENKKIKDYVSEIGLEPRFFLEEEVAITKDQDHEFAVISAQTRFEHFKKAIESDSKIIWCNRGGYGSAEILPFLQQMQKPAQEKIFIGFSDLASIANFLVEKWNWQAITAPLLGQLAFDKVSEESKLDTLDLIFGKTQILKYDLKPLNNLEIDEEAKLIGGCLSVIAGNFGTKNQINWQDKFLFLEDEGEDGERLDRYFYQIVTIINETGLKPKAIILGNFLQENPHGTPKAQNIAIAIERFASWLSDIAIFYEPTNSLGHSQNMKPIIIGAKTTINLDNQIFQKIS